MRSCKIFFLVEQCIKYDPNPHGTETSTHHLHCDDVTYFDDMYNFQDWGGGGTGSNKNF